MIANSQTLSPLICPQGSSEPGSARSYAQSRNGILIGMSYRFAAPVFLDLCDAMNPHILICGMTGSGKTYLTKCILMRLLSFCDANVIAIDFTGEYAQVAEWFYDKGSRPENLFTAQQHMCYLGLNQMDDMARVDAACATLDLMAVLMRQRGGSKTRPIFIIIDEAWKLIKKSKGLEVIIREGRKYGVGLITSSQLLQDSSMEVMSNVATTFVFRTTNAHSLEIIARSHGISIGAIPDMRALGRGSCLMISIHKSANTSAFLIRSVSGLEEMDTVSILKGKKMEVKIGIREFNGLINSLCTGDAASRVRQGVSSSRIELTELICALIEAGAQRRGILCELRKIGIPDCDIADSFSMAIARVNTK